MIFKTFDSDIDKWTTKIGIFGNSVNDILESINKRKLDIDNLINHQGLDLGEAKKQVGSFWSYLFPKKGSKDWIKNSFGDIISSKNINSYIAELDLDTAKEKLQGIFDWQEDVKNGDDTWQKYFDTLDDGENYIKDLIKNTNDLSKLTGEDLVKANQQARKSVLEHNEAIKASTLAAKAQAAALKLSSIALSAAAMAAISKAISFAATTIDNYIHRIDNAKEALADSVSAFEQTKSEIEGLNDELKTCGDRIDELQKLADSGTISIADKKELELLKEQNKELERQILLKQEDLIARQRKVAEDAANLANQEIVSSFKYDMKFYGQGIPNRKASKIKADEELVNGINAYKDYMQFLSDNPEIAMQLGEDGIKKEMQGISDVIRDMYDIISPAIEGYHKLQEYGIDLEEELSESEYERYTQMLKARDAYLKHIYDIRGTEEAYKALNAEQKKSIIQDQLKSRSISDYAARAITKNFSEEELDQLWDKDFSFTPPAMSDYETAEEYGRAYAEAWLKGLGEASALSKELTPFTTLSESQSDAVKSCKDTLSSITDISEDFKDVDITELMSTFEGYDWSGY